MNKRHPYNSIIESKLEQLPVANADRLWNDMHEILDKEMPEKKERRRFIFWFLNGNGLFVLTFISLILTGSSLFFLAPKQTSAVAIKKTAESLQPDKAIENDVARISQEYKEGIAIADEPSQKNNSNISAIISLVSPGDDAINNNFISQRQIKQSKKYTTTDQLMEPTQEISNAKENFHITPVDLESIHHGLLIATNHNNEKKFLKQQLELSAYEKKVSKSNNNNKNETGFYIGIISGVDLSSIHFRSFKTGSTKGFIIGYAFNNKWSIESGLLWDKRNVYDNGKYFNPPGYTPSNGITITSVNGRSRIYELPINVKYTITSGKNNLFATTGLSSYLMRSENYDYQYEQNNQPGGHNYLSYKNETKNWFSVVNLSAGYTRKLGNMGSLRVEPYLKVPIEDLGTGKMPIMSTGLNIGLTKKIK
jgi:hypothetical protein